MTIMLGCCIQNGWAVLDKAMSNFFLFGPKHTMAPYHHIDKIHPPHLFRILSFSLQFYTNRTIFEAVENLIKLIKARRGWKSWWKIPTALYNLLRAGRWGEILCWVFCSRWGLVQPASQPRENELMMKLEVTEWSEVKPRLELTKVSSITDKYYINTKLSLHLHCHQHQ